MFTAASFVIIKKNTKLQANHGYHHMKEYNYWTEVHVPYAQWDQTPPTRRNLSRERFIAGPHKETGGSHPPNAELPEGFQKSIFKGQVTEGAVGCHQLLGAAIFHPRRLGQDVPVNLQQNKCHSVLHLFISIWIEKCYTLKGWSLENGLSRIF